MTIRYGLEGRTVLSLKDGHRVRVLTTMKHPRVVVFGGLLWPIAWLWAYTKPVGYKLAYGTEMHEDYFFELAEKWRKGELPEVELRQLRAELDSVEARGSLTPSLRSLRDELAAGGARPAESAPVAAVQPRSA